MEVTILIAFLAYAVLTELRLVGLRRENARLRADIKRLTVSLVVACGTSAGAVAWPGPQKTRTYATTQRHPDEAVKEALIFLARVPVEDRPFYQFFHAYAESDQELYGATQDFRATLPMASTGPVIVRPFPVTKDARLWAVDIREGNWSRAAWQAVTKLDNTCRFPHVDFKLGAALRAELGVDADGTNTPHCEGVIPMAWFVRELQNSDKRRETVEDIVYYNLLYASERFGVFETVGPRQVKPASDPGPPKDPGPEPPLWKVLNWPGGVWADGKYYPPGAFTYTQETEEQKEAIRKAREKWRTDKARFVAWKERQASPTDHRGPRWVPKQVKKAVDRNFPRDLTDFQKKWGIDVSEQFLADQKLFKKNGVVVAGTWNDPRAGSIVSYNDRVLEFLNTTLGVSMRTRDFFRTSGRANPANLPLEVSLGQLEENAGEHIQTKADNYPAWLLTGAAKDGRKRAEFGDPHAVRASLDPHHGIVMTFDSCVICHYPASVVLAPGNDKVGRTLKGGANLLTFNKQDRQVIDQFFFDGDAVGGGWSYKVDGWRVPFARSLAAATKSGTDKEGWTGSEWVTVMERRRRYYDAPLNLARAAAELGYGPLAVMEACLYEGSVDAATLFLDAEPGVPRAVWDDDLFPRLARIIFLLRSVNGNLYN